MRRAKLSPRVSLLRSFRGRNTIRLNTSKPKFPPSYSKWLELKNKYRSQDIRLSEFKRSERELDRNLDADLRLCEVELLYELARGELYRVPKDALMEIADSLWEYHRGSRFTHWASRLPRSNKRDSDPQLEHLKELAVAYIFQADSEIDKNNRRDFVADKFGKGDNHKGDWELLVKQGKLSVPDFSGLPVTIDESLIEWAGQKFQMLLRKRNISNRLIASI